MSSGCLFWISPIGRMRIDNFRHRLPFGGTMRRILIILLILGPSLQGQSEPDDEVPESRHAVSIELLGRGLLGGIYYEHTIWTERFLTQTALGVGVSFFPVGGAIPLSRRSALFVPLPSIIVYVNIIPQVEWFQPLYPNIRSYIELGTYALPAINELSAHFFGFGFRFQRKPKSFLVKFGMIFFASPLFGNFGGPWPGLTFGASF